MQEVTLSKESLNTLATRIADKVCDRIGNALIGVGTSLIVLGIGVLLVEHVSIRKNRS
jgi:hypothetical protein